MTINTQKEVKMDIISMPHDDDFCLGYT